eukprot:gene4894-9761_t
MNKANDFSELLAQSQKLAAQVGLPDQIKPIHRGVFELDEASREIARSSQGGRVLGIKSEQAALRLLAQHTFDAEGLNKEVNTIELKPQYDPQEKLDSTDIEGYLAHHHDMIILTALDEAKRIAEEDIHDMQRRWAAEEWTRAKKKFMENLGLRSSSATGNISHTQNSVALIGTPHSPFSTGTGMKSSHRQQQQQQQQGFGASSSSSAVTTAPIASPLPPFISRQAVAVRLMAEASCSSSLANVPPIQQLQNGIRPVQEILSGLSTIESSGPSITSGINASDLTGYRHCLTLISGMTGEDSDKPRPCGYFTTLSMCLKDLSQDILDRRSVLTRGTRRFLERQYESVMWDRVQVAIQQNKIRLPPAAEGGSRMARLKAFATLTLRNNHLPVASTTLLLESSADGGGGGDPVPLWLLVYLCLRCGAIADASRILRQHWDQGMLRGMTEDCAVQTAECFNALRRDPAASSAPRFVPPSMFPSRELSSLDIASTTSHVSMDVVMENMQSCRNAFVDCHSKVNKVFVSNQGQQQQQQQHSVYQGTRQQQIDPYHMLVLNLLGLADVDAVATVSGLAEAAKGVAPGSTLEDFLWGGLWFVDWSAEVSRTKPQDQQRITDSTRGSSQSLILHSSQQDSLSFSAPHYSRINYSVEDVYRRIEQAGGEDYFDRNRNTPFKYVCVLLSLQRFGPAVAYLWRSGRAVEAVHITAVGLYYGLLAPQLPLEVTQVTSTAPSPADLLKMWIRQNLQRSHVTEAADYALLLGCAYRAPAAVFPGIERSHVEKFKLISLQVQCEVLEELFTSIDRNQINELVGDVGSTGSRGRGHLDRYMDTVDIEHLLCHSAQLLLTREKEPEGALHLYQLAGRYADVLTEMMSQLVAVFDPAQSQSQRAFWMAAAQGFYERHLKGGNSFVLRRLEEQGRSDVVHTFQTLSNLFLVVDLRMQGRPSEALSLLDDLRLLPSSTCDPSFSISDATQQVLSLPAPLSRVLDDVLLCAMDSTLAVYAQIKAEGGSGATREVRIEALRRRAAALVSLAAMARSKLNRADTANKLSRMEISLV